MRFGRRLRASGALATAVEAGRGREGGWWVEPAGNGAVLADVWCSNGGLQRLARRKRYKLEWRAMPGTAAAGSTRKMPVVCVARVMAADARCVRAAEGRDSPPPSCGAGDGSLSRCFAG